MDRDIEVATFGCRVNIAETQIIRDRAGAAGLKRAFIVNSCAVTAAAVREARQAARRAFRDDPARPVIVTGCAAQIATDQFAAMPEVARVIGNSEKLTSEAYGEEADARVNVGDIFSDSAMRGATLSAIEGRTRGFVQVQTGCDHRCTFCIIPFGRGNSRSLAPDEVVHAVRKFVEADCLEVVLTGIDLASYGEDIGDVRLGSLVRLILRECPDLPRLRLSSLDCIDMDETLISLFGEEERLMPSVHLSLQSGADLILKRMRRRHSRRDAIMLCERLRRIRPDIVISADVIAGFPTESEEHFAQSLALIDDCQLSRVHAFAFSPRPGTPAARMPPVPGRVIKERAQRLRDKGEALFAGCLDRHVGSSQQVLGERGGTGRTGGGLPVRINAAAGRLLRVQISGHDGTHLSGISA